jgi:hypothetical protein
MNAAVLFGRCALVALLSVPTASAQEATRSADRWGPLRGMLGEWEGTSTGQPGTGTVRRQYRLVLRERFIEVRSASTYPPQEKNPKGEVHEDVGFFSFDRARGRFLLRQFHVEGFVNEYVAGETSASAKLVFTSESIENIPAGWRARETYVFSGPDEFEELFELAEPGKDFQAYTHARLKRIR